MTTSWIHEVDGSVLTDETVNRLYAEGKAEPDNRGAERVMVVYWDQDVPEFYVAQETKES